MQVRLFLYEYDFWVGRPNYISDPVSYYRDIILTSHQLVDSVLTTAKQAESQLRSDKQYSFETKGTQLMRIESPEYVQRFSDALNGMVERQMRKAVHTVASAWYTAWIDAGQPALEMGTIEIPQDTSNARVINGIRGHD